MEGGMDGVRIGWMDSEGREVGTKWGRKRISNEGASWTSELEIKRTNYTINNWSIENADWWVEWMTDWLTDQSSNWLVDCFIQSVSTPRLWLCGPRRPSELTPEKLFVYIIYHNPNPYDFIKHNISLNWANYHNVIYGDQQSSDYSCVSFLCWGPSVGDEEIEEGAT